jgi:riboflavin biosynthesis pyrimidine reductase
VQTVPLAAPGGGISLKAVLGELAARGIRSVLVEGGASLFTSFLKEGLWDRLTVFSAPLVLGEGINSIGDLGISAVKDAVRLYDVIIKKIGSQILYEGGREETHVYRNR